MVQFVNITEQGQNAMDSNLVTDRLVKTLPRHLLLDLLDVGVSRTLKAFEIIRDNTTLSGKSARGAEGQLRFRIVEQGFQETCERYGGTLLAGKLMEGSDMRIFQPFMRFGDANSGVVLGLASMPTQRELPPRNMSREAGVALNYMLTPRLALDERDPKPGDIFVLFLIARDPARGGQVAEIAIGIVDSGYDTFLFYEPIETFMARYAPTETPASNQVASSKPLVKLKDRRTLFVPSEAGGESK